MGERSTTFNVIITSLITLILITLSSTLFTTGGESGELLLFFKNTDPSFHSKSKPRCTATIIITGAMHDSAERYPPGKCHSRR